MNKQEMINQLHDRVSYNMARRDYYEDLLRDGGDVWEEISWQQEVDWYKGKIVAFNIAIEMAERLDS